MKEMRLMQIIGDIDEKYIDEAAPADSTEIPTQNTIHLKKQKIRSGLKSAYPTATANIPSLIMRLSRGKSSRCSITMATTAE